MNKTIDIKRQLVNAATPSGANYSESQGSLTKPDAKMKVGISLKENPGSKLISQGFKRTKSGRHQTM